MNYRRKNERLVTEITHSWMSEKPSTDSHLLFRNLNKQIQDYEMNAEEYMQIGCHKVKNVEHLKVLKKKHPEDFFGGTKEKRETKRKIKQKRVIYNLNNFTQGLQQIDTNDLHKSTEDSAKKKVSQTTDEEVQLLCLKIYEYTKKREYNDKKNYSQHRLAEEKYAEQFGNMAETWMKSREGRNEQKESKPQSKPLCSKSCSSDLSRNCLNTEDYISLKKNEKKVSFKKMEKQKVRKDFKNTRSSEELSKELLEKLVLVCDEKSWDSS